MEKSVSVLKRMGALFFVFIFLFSLFAVCIPKKAFAADDKIKIVLDPGHGGSEIGTAYKNIGEKVLTYSLALKIKTILDQDGRFETFVTRSGDYTVTLLERGLYAGERGADLLLSIHFNGDVIKSKRGAGAWISVVNKFSKPDLASAIISNVTSYTGLPSDGINKRYDNAGYYWDAQKQWDIQQKTADGLSDYYGILTWGAKFGVPAIIVEHGYMSNTADCNIIFADGMIDRMAEADANAIINYYTNHTHTYAARTVDFPSFCLMNGRSSEKCTICGHKRGVETLPAAPDNHFPEYGGDISATCTTDGQSGWTCRFSSNLMLKGYPCELHGDVEITPATGHSYVVTDSRAAGHVTDGFTSYRCTKCAHSYTQYIPAEGHSYVFTGRTEPQCTVDGHVDYTCTVCGDVYTEALKAPGHTKGAVVSRADAGCTADGYIEYQCAVCASPWRETLPALGHKMNVVSETVLCTEEGERRSVCARCGEEKTEVIAPAGHKITVLEEVLPTCTADGYSAGICRICKEETHEVLASAGHQWNMTEQTAATCSESGSAKYECSVCGETKTEATVPAGHQYVLKGEIPANCENAGYYHYICSVCSAENREEIPPTGHTWDNGVQTRKAGIFRDGEMKYTCTSDSSHTRREVVPSFVKANPDTTAQIVIIVLSALPAAAAILYIKKGVPFPAKRKISPKEKPQKIFSALR